MNRLYFGDNLKWLSNRKEFPDASVDLVYLDPPFNSNADYNVLFRETSGELSQAQFHAFTDTWSWADAAETYHQFIDDCSNVAVVEMMEAFHSFLKNSPMMAYLAMMAPRIVELQSRAQRNRQPLSALRSDRESLSANASRCDL
jgi:site-specific DNA-methyltransferase (adenine-specific)